MKIIAFSDLLHAHLLTPQKSNMGPNSSDLLCIAKFDSGREKDAVVRAKDCAACTREGDGSGQPYFFRRLLEIYLRYFLRMVLAGDSIMKFSGFGPFVSVDCAFDVSTVDCAPCCSRDLY